MGKRFLLLFIGTIGHMVFAQQWVDSIQAAREAYHKKEYSTAERIYRAHYKKAKAKGGIDEELAQTKYRQRNFKGAIEYYQKSLKTAKKSTEKGRIKHNLGNAYFEAGDYPKAIESYKDALRLNPSNEKTRYNLNEAIRRQQNKQQKTQNPPPKTPKNKPKRDPSNPSNNNSKKDKKNNSGESRSGQSNSSKLQRKDVDRKLDELAKKEGETRRKMNRNSGKKQVENTSTKDW